MLPKLAAWYAFLFVIVACMYYSRAPYRTQERVGGSWVTRHTLDAVCVSMAVYAAREHPWWATS